MPKFIVITRESYRGQYEVEADSSEEAGRILEVEGTGDPRVEFVDEGSHDIEVYDVWDPREAP